MDIKSSFTSPVIRTSQATKPSKKSAEATPASDTFTSEATEKNFSIQLPNNFKKRALVTGGGALATGLGAALFGGFSMVGLGAIAAAGGLAGAALSSDTVSNAYSDFKAYRAEKKAEARLEDESAKKAEELFQAKVEAAASEQAEAKWQISGEGLVAKKVESDLTSRVKAEAASKVEAQIKQRLDEAVSTRVEAQMKDKADEIEQRVENQIETQIAARVDSEASSRVQEALAERIESLVEARTEQAIEKRSDEIQSQVKSRVEAHVKAEAEAELEKRNKISNYVSDIELHMKLALESGKQSFKAGIEPYKDGFEIMVKTADSMPAADKQLMQAALESDSSNWKQSGNLNSRSEYMMFKQTATVLKNSTDDKPGSLDPKAYLDVLNMKNNTWDSGKRLMKMGLNVLIKHGDLSPSEKMICEKALDNSGMSSQEEHQYIERVFRVLAGQKL